MTDETEKLKEQLDLANSLLLDVIIQATTYDGELDSMALTSYADAMRYLGKIGLIKIDREFGRRVIGRVA